MTLDPVFGEVWTPLALAAAAAALMVPYTIGLRGVAWIKRLLPAVLRLAALGVLAIVLYRPQIIQTETLTQPNRIAILVDRSESLLIPDVPADGDRRITRVAQLQRLLNDHADDFETLQQRFDPALTGIGAKPMPLKALEAAAEEPGTAVGDALAESAKISGRLVGVLVISDGANTVGRSIPDAARELPEGVPLYAIALGPAQAEAKRPDLRITRIHAPSRADLGARIPVTISLAAHGLQGGRTKVRLTANGAFVEEAAVDISSDSFQDDVLMSYRPRTPGTVRLQAVAAPLEEEILTQNNARHLYLRVEQPTVRVVYIEGRLGLDHRALAAALEGAPELETRMVRAFFKQSSKDDPLRRALGDLKSLRPHVIVLARVDANRLGPIEIRELRMAVDQGAGLLFMADAAQLAAYRRSDMAALLPFHIPSSISGGAPSRVAPGPEAERHPAVQLAPEPSASRAAWRALPPLLEASGLGTDDLKQGANALLHSKRGAPVCMTQRYGEGRVAALVGAGWYRWANAGAEPHATHDRFMIQLVRWAAQRDAPTRPLRITLSRHTLRTGDRLGITAQTARTAGLEDIVVTILRERGPGPDPEPVRLHLRKKGAQ